MCGLLRGPQKSSRNEVIVALTVASLGSIVISGKTKDKDMEFDLDHIEINLLKCY